MNVKNFLIFIGLSLCGLCCEKSANDESLETPPKDVNGAPAIPQLIFPSNFLLCTNNDLTFQWKGSLDPANDQVQYQVEVAKDNQFEDIVHSTTISKTTLNLKLEKGEAHYWRVKAVDSDGASSEFSETFSLYTEYEGLTNYLPFAPELITPSERSIHEKGDITLAWSATDIDEDLLVFDVYFGVENPPTTLMVGNLEADSLEVSVAEFTDYYWRIIVKDNNGGSTVGEVWSFSVE